MKIAMLLSGGVDSSVALKILKDQGHDVTAFYLKIWLEDELSHLNACPWEEDLQYAQQVCTTLDVPLKVLNMQDEYHKKIVTYTINETKKGLTPNPDILCNQYIKFGFFIDAIDNSFEKVASGHYAQIINNNLVRSPDPIKDQSYFLCNLTKKQLSKILFPIGHLIKEEVRQLAQKFNLPTKNRKDSQGICFLGKFKFKDFLQHHLGESKGNLINFDNNKKVGIHNGHWFYTIGQRKNIRLANGPWYVVSKNSEKNIVYISNNYNHLEEERKSFKVENFNWINGNPPTIKNLLIKMRHRSIPQLCSFELFDNYAQVTLEHKDQGIAAGQFAVFYNDNICLGSGIIE